MKKNKILLEKLEKSVLKNKGKDLSEVVKALEGVNIKDSFKGSKEEANDLTLKIKEVAESLKSYMGEDTLNNISHPRINKFFKEFIRLHEGSDNTIISKEVSLIKADLDRIYIKGDFEKLNEIKHELLDEMYLSSSRIHGATIGTLSLKGVTMEEKSSEINLTFSTFRALQSQLRSLILYIDKYRYLSVLTAIKTVEKISDKIITIEDIAVNRNSSKEIYRILIDAGLIDKDTKIFIDSSKGGKVFLCAILFYLHGKGYYKYKPKNEDYLSICLHSFAISISLGTIKGKSEFPMSAVNGLNIPVFNSI